MRKKAKLFRKYKNTQNFWGIGYLGLVLGMCMVIFWVFVGFGFG
jgi:hypothetical protein